MGRQILILIYLLMAPSLSWAGYDEGAAAVMRGDYATALTELRPVADQGDPRAQVLLGNMYREGLGVPKDASSAALWFRRAADQRLPQAQLQLGHLHRKGAGVPQSYVEAASWYRKAAEQNLTAGQVSLGAAYFHGHGVPQDFVQAYMWFSLALTGVSARPSDLALATKGIKLSESKMTPKQIAEAKRRTQAWMPAAE